MVDDDGKRDEDDNRVAKSVRLAQPLARQVYVGSFAVLPIFNRNCEHVREPYTEVQTRHISQRSARRKMISSEFLSFKTSGWFNGA